jgi:hypothetical protein
MTLTASKSTLTASTNNLAASIIFLTASESLSQPLKRSKTNNICLQLVKIKKENENVKYRNENDQYKPTTCQDRSKNEFSPKYSKIESKTNCLFLNL